MPTLLTDTTTASAVDPSPKICAATPLRNRSRAAEVTFCPRRRQQRLDAFGKQKLAHGIGSPMPLRPGAPTRATEPSSRCGRLMLSRWISTLVGHSRPLRSLGFNFHDL